MITSLGTIQRREKNNAEDSYSKHKKMDKEHF